MEELEQLKNEIQQIKERNARVEADKAWETSFSRLSFRSPECNEGRRRRKF